MRSQAFPQQRSGIAGKCFGIAIDRRLTHAHNKCRGNASLKKAQLNCRMVTIAAQLGLLQRSKTSSGAYKGRFANAVVIRGICTEMSLHRFFYANSRPNIGFFSIENKAETSKNSELYFQSPFR